MATILTCKECNRDYNVEKLKPGSKLRCRGCSTYLTVPGGQAMACVSCGQMFAAKNVKEGLRFRCQKCSTMMRIDSQLVPRRIVDDSTDKRVEIVQESVQSTPDETTSEHVEEVIGHGAAIQAQKTAPPPASRRFGDGQQFVPDLDDLINQKKLIGAFLFSKDGLLLAGHCENEFDAEILANSVYYYSNVSRFLGDTFAIGGNGVSRLQMEKGTARFHVMGSDILLVLSKGEYDGKDDSLLHAKLNEKKDLS